MTQEIPPPALLPCGCFVSCAVVEGENIFTISPCHAGCTNLRHALDIAAEQNVPVRLVES